MPYGDEPFYSGQRRPDYQGAIQNQPQGPSENDQMRARDSAEAAPLYGQNYDQVLGRAFDRLPGEQQYYADIQNRQQAALRAAIQADQHRAKQYASASGLGGSSAALQQQTRLSGLLGQGVQNIATGIAGQQFQASEDRLAQSLAFERQKQMLRLGGREQRATDRKNNNVFNQIAGAVGGVAGSPIPLGGGQQAPQTQPTYGQTYSGWGPAQSGGYLPPRPNDPYHDSPVRY